MAKKTAKKTDGEDKLETAHARQLEQMKLCSKRYPELSKAIAALGLAFDEVEPQDVSTMSGLVRRIMGGRSGIAREQRKEAARERKTERVGKKLAKIEAEKAKLEALKAELEA